MVRFRAAGVDHELRTGKKTPIGANNYVSTGAAAPSTPSRRFRVTSLEKSLDDLRERRPLRFDREGVQRIEATWVDGGVVLEKKDGKWRLVAPLDTDADSETVETLLSDLVFLRASGFVDAPPPDKEVGLDTPQYRVVLVDAPQDGKEPMRHELRDRRRARRQGARRARRRERRSTRFRTSASTRCRRAVVAFRWKTLANFVATDAQRFEISFADASAKGASQVVTITGRERRRRLDDEARGDGSRSRVAHRRRAGAPQGRRHRRREDGRRGARGGRSRAAARDGARARQAARRRRRRAGAREGDLRRREGRSASSRRCRVARPCTASPARSREHVPISLEAFRNRFVAKEPPPQPSAPCRGAAVRARRATTSPRCRARPTRGRRRTRSREPRRAHRRSTSCASRGSCRRRPTRVPSCSTCRRSCASSSATRPASSSPSRSELGETTLNRCYSLSSAPDCDDELQFTVKRVAEGRVSNWFHDEIREGHVVRVLPPDRRLHAAPGEPRGRSRSSAPAAASRPCSRS